MWAEWRWELISEAKIRELVGAMFGYIRLNGNWGFMGAYRGYIWAALWGLKRLDESGHWGGSIGSRFGLVEADGG